MKEAKNKQISETTSTFENRLALKDKEVKQMKALNLRFEAQIADQQEKSRIEKETLQAEYSQKIQEIKTELERRLEMTVEHSKELTNEKELRISQLEQQIADLKCYNQLLTDELTAKLSKIQDSTDILVEELVRETPKNSVYMMENGQVCEVNDEEDQIQVIQRERAKEREDFILWLDGKQLWEVLKDRKWTLSLHSGQFKVDTLEIVGNDKEWDKFYQIENRI